MTAVAALPRFDRNEAAEAADPMPLQECLRRAEALVFASSQPVSEKDLAARLPSGADVAAVMSELRSLYATRGVNLVRIGDSWAFRTAGDLAFLFADTVPPPKKLSRAALEVLAIIAYHQPTTRAEIEEIRGVETSKGTLDLLLETQWVRIRGRRRSPGRPVVYATTAAFLDHFQLDDVASLPGMDELKGAGLLSPQVPSAASTAPLRGNVSRTGSDEDALGDIDLEELGLLTPRVEDE